DAIDISSMTLTSRRRSGSGSSALISVAPSMRATCAPPPASDAARPKLATPMTPKVPAAMPASSVQCASSHSPKLDVPRNSAWFSVYVRTPTATANVVSSATTRNAARKTATSTRVVRRDFSCRAKKSNAVLLAAYAASGSAEADARHFAFGLVADIEVLGLLEAENVRDEVAREVLAGVVVAHDGVV